jgi:hypothetical protein
MAKLPDGFSMRAVPIRAALSEGRTEDARTAIVELLRAGKADKVVQRLAADLLKPTKRGRGRRKSLPRHWYEIGEEFGLLRDDGVKCEDARQQVARKFGYSETHVRKAIATYENAKDEARACEGPV